MEEIQTCRKSRSTSERAFCDSDGVSHFLAEGAGVEHLEERAGQPGRDRRPHKGGSQGFDFHHIQPGKCKRKSIAKCWRKPYFEQSWNVIMSRLAS
jgi:hypothetical protein